MRTILVHIKNPTPGDLVIVNACHAKGGKDSAKYKIRGPWKQVTKITDDGTILETQDVSQDNATVIADQLMQQINKDWLPECVQAKVKNDFLVINCTDLYDAVTITAEVHGDGTVTELVEY
jgi:hypothetical protein